MTISPVINIFKTYVMLLHQFINKSSPIMFVLHKSLSINFSQIKQILTEKSLPNETKAAFTQATFNCENQHFVVFLS